MNTRRSNEAVPPPGAASRRWYTPRTAPTGSGERVLVITTSYPRDEADPSGHFVRAQVRRMAAEGAEVRVLAAGEVGERRDQGWTVRGLGAPALFAWPGAAKRLREQPWRSASLPLAVLRGWWQLLGDTSAPSRVVAHWSIPSAWPIGLASSAPLDIVSHGADVRLLVGLPARLRASLVRKLLSRCSTWTFVSWSLLDELASSLPADLERAIRTKSCVEPMPLDLPPLDELPDPRAHHGLDGRRYVVWVGRDVPGKRVELALRAAALAHCELVLIGVDAGRAPTGVRALGTLPRRETLGLIARSEALLSTSAAEGAPTAVREARHYGVPVVACAAGDLARWAAEDPHIQLTADDAPSIAKALVELGVSSEPAEEPVSGAARWSRRT